jgi:hypothetical protein
MFRPRHGLMSAVNPTKEHATMATKTKTIESDDLDATVVRDAVELPSAGEAIGYAEAGGGRAIRVDGMNLVVPDREAERLERAGVGFYVLGEVEYPPGSGNYRVVTIPVN